MQRRQGNANARNANGGRASVKNQRRVNSQQPVAANKKKPQQKENAHKQPSAPVGVSGVPLSARFSTLQKEAVTHQPVAAAKKKNVVVNIKKPGQQPSKKGAKQQLKVQQQQKQQQQKQKMQVVAQANRTKRQETVNQRRKGLAVAAPPAKGGKKNNKATTAKPKKKTPAKGKDEKKKPVTGEDLDVEMDSYWHKAGKGPDPQQALLDRQMEEYWAGKPKRDGEGAPASETTSA